MTREELINALRDECKDCNELGTDRMCQALYICPVREAADEIESLVAENTQLKFELQQFQDKPVRKSVFATRTRAFRVSDIIRFEKSMRWSGKPSLALWLHSQEDVVFIEESAEAVNGYFEELCRNMED